MLTADLLRARVVQRELRPSFVDPSAPRVVERADQLVALFREGIGRPRGELRAEVEGLIGDGLDVKLVRGLAKVLDDTSTWSSECPVDPAMLRRALYEAVGSTPGRVAAQAAWEALAAQYNQTVEQLQRLMFADRKDEQELEACEAPDGVWLLHRYNTALVQAVLVRAEQVEVVLQGPSPERLAQLFRAVKFHGLMYRVQRTDSAVTLALDGPASLLTHSTRYGLALASWFPSLPLQTCPWKLSAEVRWGERRLRKTLNLSSDLGLRTHARDQGAWVSRVEQWFEERFAALNSGWVLTREGVPLNLGGEAVICPDFTFRKAGREAHLEILGFWRKDWLQRRLALIQKHGPGNLVLAVSSKLDCAKGELAGFPGRLVPFKEVVPPKDVLEAVEAVARPIPGVPGGESPPPRAQTRSRATRASL